MTRRERLERKIEKRGQWAESATAKAAQAYQTSQSLVEHIPMGQPILVGHHSEKQHRRTLDRSWNALGKSVEMTRLAEHHEQKAAGLAAALDRTIFSDDPDAIENIEARIKANEEKREQMKQINKLYRKGDASGLAAIGLNLENLQAKLKDAYSWCQQPHPAYELSNLGARITSDRKRLEFVKRQQQEQAAAEATENGVKIDTHSNGYSTVRFAEKPDYSIIRALKDAGFRWGGGSWFGQTNKMPATVAELVAA